MYVNYSLLSFCLSYSKVIGLDSTPCFYNHCSQVLAVPMVYSIETTFLYGVTL